MTKFTIKCVLSGGIILFGIIAIAECRQKEIIPQEYMQDPGKTSRTKQTTEGVSEKLKSAGPVREIPKLETRAFLNELSQSLWDSGDTISNDLILERLKNFSLSIRETKEAIAVELLFDVCRPDANHVDHRGYPFYELIAEGRFGDDVLPWLWKRLESERFESRNGGALMALLRRIEGERLKEQLNDRIKRATDPQTKADWQAAYDYLLRLEQH